MAKHRAHKESRTSRKIRAIVLALALVGALTTEAVADHGGIPNVTADPNTNLNPDGQNITVNGAGFTPGATVEVSQCHLEPDVHLACTARAEPTAAEDGSFSVVIFVQYQMGGGINCDDPGCFVRARNNANPGEVDTASISFAVDDPVADLEVSLTSTPDGAVDSEQTPAVAGEEIVYHVEVTNNGPSDNAGYSVSFDVPAGTTFVSASEGCSLPESPVTCTSDSLAADTSETFNITLAIDSGYVIANEGSDPDANEALLSAAATITSTQTDQGDNTASDSDSHDATVIGIADLAISLSAAPAGDHSGNYGFVAGEQAIYTISVDNLGPSDNGGYTVGFDVPAGTTFISASEGCSLPESPVTCTSDGLPVDTSETFNITLAIDSGYVIANEGTDPDPNEALLQAAASLASSNTTDDDGANDSDTQTVDVVGVADLEVTSHTVAVHDAPAIDPLVSGNFNFLTADVVVKNNGPSDAEGVSVTDTYPTDPLSIEGSLLDEVIEVEPIGILPADGTSMVPQVTADVRNELRDGLYSSSNTVDVHSSITTDDALENNSDTQPVGVYTVPDAPVLELAEPGNEEIGVQWRRGDDSTGDPDGGDPIEGYDVILTPPSGAEVICFFSGDTPNAAGDRFSLIASSITCDGPVANDTTYDVQVATRNGAGESDRSNTIAAIPCADCAVEFVADELTILTVENGAGGLSIQQANGTACETLLHENDIGASDANPIVVCDEYPDAGGENDGLIASLREQPDTGACGEIICVGGIEYFSNVPFDLSTDTFIREVVILDKSITPDDKDFSVFVDGELIGSSDRDTWCDRIDPLPANGCVEKLEVLNSHTAPNGIDGVGDVMAVFRFFINPSKGIG